MGDIRLYETKHMVVEVDSCKEKVWLHQDLLARDEDYTKMYELKGKLMYSKGSDFEDHQVDHRGRKQRRLEEVTIYVDKDVSDHEVVIVQEVLQYKKESVGTIARSKPKGLEGENNATLFTGVVLGNQEVPVSEEVSIHFTSVLIDIEGKGKFRECGVFEGLDVVIEDQIMSYDEAQVGSVVKFSANEGDLEYYEEDERYVFDKVTIINRYS